MIMKDFLKTFLASFTALVIYGIITFIILFGWAISGLSGLFGSDSGMPVMSESAVLTIDMETFTLSEQSHEADVLDMLKGDDMKGMLGVFDAVAAINAAAFDPAVKYIYLKPDAASGGTAQLEEFRNALLNFRAAGKAVVSYIESPGNAGYYLASASDKIYMTPHLGGMSSFTGLSSRLIFLKDALDFLGVNVQLIRHGKYKSAGETFIRNSASKENMEQNEEMVMSMWNSIRGAIAESRDLQPEDIDRMLNELELDQPSDFLEKGLVDELLTYDQLQDKIAMLFMVEDYKDVKSITIQDYAELNGPGNPMADDKIAIIYVDGEIVDGDGTEEVAGDRYAQIIKAVREEENVKAVVLRVNSPGGSVLASEKIKTQIDSLKTQVPVIASYGDYAASGGYWISANCDYIYANETTLTGSIGVFSMIPDLKDVINDKLHINITAVNSNKHADMLGMMRPLDRQEKDMMQASVEKVYEKFTSIVSQGRNMSVEDVDAIAQGRVWTGAQALEIGLVDAIGTLENAVLHAAALAGSEGGIGNIQIVEYPKPQTTLEMLNSRLGGEGLIEIPNSLKGISTAFKDWSESQSGKVYARIPYAIEIK
jgi:protease-4